MKILWQKLPTEEIKSSNLTSSIFLSLELLKYSNSISYYYAINRKYFPRNDERKKLGMQKGEIIIINKS